MPHILILDQWKQRINALHERAETLHDNIENEMYEGKQLQIANELMESIEQSVSGDLNAATIDGVINEVETFLGI